MITRPSIKENAALKAKLKVLVEKVEEYRATEDSMRATLLTAQRMADSIVKEAEQKRDQMMDPGEIDAKMKITRLKNWRPPKAPAPGTGRSWRVSPPPAGPCASGAAAFDGAAPGRGGAPGRAEEDSPFRRSKITSWPRSTRAFAPQDASGAEPRRAG